MAERTLRGARLGGQSFEDERGIEFAARQQVGYRCKRGHEFEITMSVEADIPATWECPRCGAESLSVAGIEPEVKAEKPARTHWDMLLERRSEKELEDILKERLELLRALLLRTHNRRLFWSLPLLLFPFPLPLLALLLRRRRSTRSIGGR